MCVCVCVCGCERERRERKERERERETVNILHIFLKYIHVYSAVNLSNNQNTKNVYIYVLMTLFTII